MRRMVLGPSLYRASQNRPLTADDYDTLVEHDTVGVLPDGTVKFLYLRGAIPRKTANGLFQCLNDLAFQDAANSHRTAIRSSAGGELHFGWVDRHSEGACEFAPTHMYPHAYIFWLAPLLNGISNLLKKHLSKQWEAQRQTASHNGPMSVAGVTRSDLLQNQPVCQPLPPIFSTITVNKNVVCRTHCDTGNLSGLACMTAFGSWEGAELCFPRFAVAFPLRPGDVLMADTSTELHGNIAPLAGTRISVVAYLRSMPIIDRHAQPRGSAVPR